LGNWGWKEGRRFGRTEEGIASREEGWFHVRVGWFLSIAERCFIDRRDGFI